MKDHRAHIQRFRLNQRQVRIPCSGCEETLATAEQMRRYHQVIFVYQVFHHETVGEASTIKAISVTLANA